MTESRRRDGEPLGPKPVWLQKLTYDAKQLAAIVEPRQPKTVDLRPEPTQDVNGLMITGP